MKTQNLDNLFKEIIENSEDYYKEYSDKAQNNVWHEIQKGKTRSSYTFWKRLAVAATILVLLSLSISLYFTKKQGDAIIADLRTQVERFNNQNLVGTNKQAPVTKIVTIEKEHMVKVPVISTVEKVIYVRDTVYIKEFADKPNEKEPISPVLQMIEQKETVTPTEIILTSTTKKKKKQPFSIERFLQKRQERNSNKESGSIMVFTAKL